MITVLTRGNPVQAMRIQSLLATCKALHAVDLVSSFEFRQTIGWSRLHIVLPSRM